MTSDRGDETHRSRPSASDRLYISLIVTLILAGGILYLLVDSSIKQHYPHLAELLNIVEGALLTFVMTTFLFEFYTKKNFDEQIEKAIAISLSDHVDPYLSSMLRLDEQRRMNFIEKAILRVGGSLMGDFAGKLLWDDLISRYIQKRSGFRTKFRYNIEITECTRSDPIAATLEHLAPKIDIDKFCARNWVCRQELRYHKEGGIVNADGKVIAIFTLNEHEIYKYMPMGDIYFRDPMTLSDELRRLLNEVSNAELAKWVREGWQFEAVCQSDSLDYTVEVTGEPGKKVIRVVIDPRREMGPDQLVTLSFYVPHTKSEPDYLVMLPEPIDSPEINFTIKLPGMKARDFVFFGSTQPALIERFAKDTRIKVSGSGWTFPTSGVLFAWSGNDDSSL